MDVKDRQQDSGLQGSPPPSRDWPDVAQIMRHVNVPRWEDTPLRQVSAEQVARGLGWFSIGLGLAELFAPRMVAKLCGGDGRHTGLIRLYGLREIAAGLMIFSEGRKPARGLWSRVAGDAMDLATLGVAAALPHTNKAGVAFATANVAAVTALDVLCAAQMSRDLGKMTEDGAVRVKCSLPINRPREDVYAFWRDFRNMPRFMYHLESVREAGPNRWHWVTQGPGGKTIEWISEVTEDRPNELLSWRTAEGDLDHSGSVRFEPKPGSRGTLLRVELQYHAPLGPLSQMLTKLLNTSPEQQMQDDLRRFKQVIETGEVLRSDGSPEGMGRVIQRVAQPAGSGE